MKSLRSVQLFATPWTVVWQAPPFLSLQEKQVRVEEGRAGVRCAVHFPTGSGGAAGSKARRPCTSATRSPGPPPQPCSRLAPPLTCPPCQGAEGNRTALGGSTSFLKGAAAEGPVTAAYHSPGGALTRRTRASRGLLSAAGWASPSGTVGASCWPGAGVEQRCASLAALSLPLRWGATAGMPETRPPSGSAGRTLRTTGFLGWSTHSPPGLRLPRLRNLPVASGHWLCAAVTALAEVEPCVGLQDEEAVKPKLPGAACRWEARPPAL